MQTTFTGRVVQIPEAPQRPRQAKENRQRLLSSLPVTEHRLDLAGIATSVLEGGAGPSLLLLHGPGGNALHWMRVIPKLVSDYRLVIPDLPGQGASEVIHGDLAADGVVAWLGELIRRTCTSRPALVGYAVGGAIAARFAARFRTQLSRLVLVDSLGLTTFAPAPQFAGALNEFLARPTVESYEGLWRQCAHDLDALRNAMSDTWSLFEAYNLDRATTPAVMASLHTLMEHFGIPAIPSTELERIGVPTTLIWGRHDLATPLAIAESASARYAWPLHVIEHVADDPAIESPDEFVRALRTALAPMTEGER